MLCRHSLLGLLLGLHAGVGQQELEQDEVLEERVGTERSFGARDENSIGWTGRDV